MQYASAEHVARASFRFLAAGRHSFGEFDFSKCGAEFGAVFYMHCVQPLEFDVASNCLIHTRLCFCIQILAAEVHSEYETNAELTAENDRVSFTTV